MDSKSHDSRLDYAIQFLANPHVQDVPRELKIEFLATQNVHAKDIDRALEFHENLEKKKKQGDGVDDSSEGLAAAVARAIPPRRARVQRLRREHADVPIGQVTAGQLLGGARGVRALLCETSSLDPEEGIRYRGLTLAEACAALPRRAPGGGGGRQPLAEGALWLLLAGEVPTETQAMGLVHELRRRRDRGLPAHAEAVIRAFPAGAHPMSRLAAALAALQTESAFARRYARGDLPREEMWAAALEDSLDLLAWLPLVAGLIYRCTYRDGAADLAPARDPDEDLAACLGRVMAGPGRGAAATADLLRLYLVVHADHEAGNASAHAARLAGSALADPYRAAAAAVGALAGPLHGGANQEVLSFILGLRDDLQSRGQPITEASVREYTWATLRAGRVVPGFGHAVLRKTDPRYVLQASFARENLPEDDELYQIVRMMYKVVPEVLIEHGKTKNPWPNVDAHSGVLLWHYGIREIEFYPVLFAVGRALGVLSQVIWDRALALPLERPKSVSLEWLERQVSGSSEGKSKL